MLLGFLAHHECIHILARVHDGGGHGISAQGQTADVRVIPIRSELAQEAADELGGLAVQGGATQVNVVIGLFAGGQCDLAVHHGQFLDELGEALLVGGVHFCGHLGFLHCDRVLSESLVEGRD